VNHLSVDFPWDNRIVDYCPTYKSVPLTPSGYTQRGFFDELVLVPEQRGATVVPWLNGAYVTATADEIRCRPLSVYEQLLDTGLSRHVNPEEAYLMERAWYTLWRKPVAECVQR
jgi:hypothetical protein